MSDPTDIGDFTLKQLLHLYQLSEKAHAGKSISNSNMQAVSDEDAELFASLLSDKKLPGMQQSSNKETNNSLTDILDSLINNIDSES